MKKLLLALLLCIGYGNLIRQCNSGDSKACAELTYVSEQDCDKGEARGCYNAAISYAEGKGVRADFNKAMEFFGKACDLGVQKGCEEILMQQCKDGNSRACSDVLTMYYEHQNAQQTQQVADYKHPMFHTKPLEIAQLQEMGLGIVLLVMILAVIFGALYFVDRKSGFVDTIFRKITTPHGKVSRVVAGICIGFQVLGTIVLSGEILFAPFENTHSNLFLFVVTLINLFDIALMILCVYFNINFLYRYNAFWLYLVCFWLDKGILKIAESLNLWWLLFIGSVIMVFLQITMVFHYIWYRKNKDTLGVSQNKPKDEPTDDVQERLIVGFLLGEFAEAELMQSLQHFIPKAQMDTMLPRLITDKLLFNRILSGASEMTSDSLQMSAIAVSVADQMNQYLRGEIEQIPEALSNLVAIADKQSFWRIHKTLLYVWIVEKGKQSFKQMDETEKAMFLNAFVFLYGANALEEFLRQG